MGLCLWHYPANFDDSGYIRTFFSDVINNKGISDYPWYTDLILDMILVLVLLCYVN